MNLAFAAIACFTLSADPAVSADLVIRNVSICDGSGDPPIIGDLAIESDRIVAIGKFATAGSFREIEGTGLVAAPGFIDLHNHSDRPITRKSTRLNVNYLTQGVTTVVTGNCGGGRADVAAYLAEIDEAGAGTNVAHLIPQGSVRREVLGSDNRPAAPSELKEMLELIESGMQAGGFGMSTGLIYVPSKYANTEELVALVRVVGRYDGIYATHMRNEGSRLLESVDEALDIGIRSEVRVHISHFKASGSAAWGLAADAVRLIEQARQKGQRVTADQYPYIASSTSLGAMVVPDRYRSQNKLVEALDDPQSATELRAAIESGIEARRGGASLFIASYSKRREWQGKDLASLAAQQQRSVLDLVLEIQKSGVLRW